MAAQYNLPYLRRSSSPLSHVGAASLIARTFSRSTSETQGATYLVTNFTYTSVKCRFHFEVFITAVNWKKLLQSGYNSWTTGFLFCRYNGDAPVAVFKKCWIFFRVLIQRRYNEPSWNNGDNANSDRLEYPAPNHAIGIPRTLSPSTVTCRATLPHCQIITRTTLAWP